MHTIDIAITSDFICPWCWVGYRHLSIAIQNAGMQDVVKLSFLPFELNPDMPETGMDRHEYRSQKFGTWENAQQKDLHLAKVGSLVDLQFNYELIARTPNTRAAHRLMHFAQLVNPGNATALYERMFSAYFSEGKDIGDLGMLTQLAVENGYDQQQVANYLSSRKGEQEVIDAESRASNAGISSVPFYETEGHVLNGAQPVSMFTEILLSRLHTGF